MSWLSPLGHLFKALFGAHGDIAQGILHDVSSFVQLADPIILDVESELKPIASDKTARVAGVLKFLGKYEPDVQTAVDTANRLAGLPTEDLLRQAAVFALTTFVPAGTTASLLNLAVELAYNIFKRAQQAKASQSIPSTPAPNPAAA
jgi:hypothetical protein